MFQRVDIRIERTRDGFDRAWGKRQRGECRRLTSSAAAATEAAFGALQPLGLLIELLQRGDGSVAAGLAFDLLLISRQRLT